MLKFLLRKKSCIDFNSELSYIIYEYAEIYIHPYK